MAELKVASQSPEVRKVLLLCGILSSVLWIGGDLIAAMLYRGYSYTSQAVSELSSIGAPTRSFLIPLITLYEVLVIAFGLGILATGSRNRALRFTAILLIASAIMGQVGLFFPMHLRGDEKTISDTMHLVFGTINTLLFPLTVGIGATVNGKWFFRYSIGTILILIAFAVLTGTTVPGVAAGQSTPWLGIYERFYVYGYMLWVMVLAIFVLRTEKGKSTE